jgi:CubicO group peptidase (beta-lactamase class C family)
MLYFTLGQYMNIFCKGLLLISVLFPVLIYAQTTDYIPEQLNDGWITASPTSKGLAEGFINELRLKSQDGTYKELVSVIVIKEGKLIVEEYFNGSKRSVQHDVRSVGKSFTSTLFGISLDKGYIKSEEQLVYPLLRGYQKENPPKNFKKLKFKHLLSMSSGLDANVDDSSSIGNEEKMYETSDWVKFAADTPFIYEPGSHWAYASINPTLLGHGLETALKGSLAEFANNELFLPLKITDYNWEKSPKNRIIAAGNLLIRARDMAKLGQLYLNKGIWNGKRIISNNWVSKATSPLFSTGLGENSSHESYGFFWWHHNFKVKNEVHPVSFASGNGGQKIYIVSSKDMIVVIQSKAYGKGWAHKQSAKILLDAIQAIKAI